MILNSPTRNSCINTGHLLMTGVRAIHSPLPNESKQVWSRNQCLIMKSPHAQPRINRNLHQYLLLEEPVN